MRRFVTVMVVALGVGCVIPQTLPVHLPPPDAPIETRVVAYRSLAAMPHRGMNGWRMRTGADDPVQEMSEARGVLQNSPQATQVLEDYDSTRRLGMGFLLGGLVAAMVMPTYVLISLGDRSERIDSGTFAGASIVTLVGLVLTTIGTLVVSGTEHFVPEAAEAYNGWLWRRLALPERLSPEGGGATAPRPAGGLTTQSPW